jgi:hypothetical protein
MYIGNVNELTGKLDIEFFRPHLKAWWFSGSTEEIDENDGEGVGTSA